jgi:protein O-GlcNAc transferase
MRSESAHSELLWHAQQALDAGDVNRAERLYRQVLRAKPAHPQALLQSAILADQRGRQREALSLIDRLLALRPASQEARFYRGAVLHEMGRFAEAIAEYDEALRLQPDYREAWHNRGVTLTEAGRLAAALENWDCALALSPSNAEWHFGRAYVLAELGRFQDALVGYNRAIALQPGNAVAHNNKGNVLKELGQYSGALECFTKALVLFPNYADAFSNIGNVLKEMGRNQEALANYDTAIRLKPTSAVTRFNRGNLLCEEGRLEQAEAELQRALQAQPDLPQADAFLAYVRMRLCDWVAPSKSTPLVERVRRGERNVPPFILLFSPSNPADQFACAQRWADAFSTAEQAHFAHARRPPSGKLRLGYLSADFRNHATSFLIAELFERHSRAQFDVAAYSYGPDDGSDMRRRIIKAVDRFVDIRQIDLATAQERIYQDGVDILIDLMGYSRGARTGLLTRRPAPVQVNFLGYPGTMGADFIDYILVDPYVVPAEEQRCYREHLVQLPRCYQPNDSKRQIDSKTPLRAECNLPDVGFVFCCFNASHKITPEFFSIWMRVLAAVPGSVLWLLNDNPAAERNLRREAVARGVAGERLVFASHLPLAEHLARHRVADLFLDTLPYNAHTTGSDALWAGLPVLSCVGTTFPGRVGGSLLRAVDLPELITESAEEYEAMALKLAREPGLLGELRRRLAESRSTKSLFDIAAYARGVEAAYTRMWRVWQSGSKPESFRLIESGEGNYRPECL